MTSARGWTVVCAGLIASLATGQVNQRAELYLPHGPVTRLASPDGSRVLYGVPYQSGANDGPQLWIEDTGTHRQQMLLSIAGTLSAAWSSDWRAFSVADHWASDRARAYIYDATTLQRLDLARPIMAADPDAARFTDAHAYFEVERWEGPQQVIVHFHGHTDQAPVQCFHLRYRVSRAGVVEKLEQRVFPVDQEKFCD